jgi:hypothetical protein
VLTPLCDALGASERSDATVAADYLA